MINTLWQEPSYDTPVPVHVQDALWEQEELVPTVRVLQALKILPGRATGMLGPPTSKSEDQNSANRHPVGSYITVDSATPAP